MKEERDDNLAVNKSTKKAANVIVSNERALKAATEICKHYRKALDKLAKNQMYVNPKAIVGPAGPTGPARLSDGTNRLVT